MNKKALTAAIAASLAAPMAAQAVDFTISGHVNRGIFITDTDDGSEVTVSDNGSSGTRIRATGSGKLDTGHTAGIQLEYGAGSSLSVRHANVWFSGDFGKVALGQGSEASDSGVYSDKSGVFGIGQGQDFGESSLGDYFPSLDGGTRTEVIRYDTPALGPVGISVSAGNGDRYGAKAVLNTEMMDSDIKVQLAYGKVNTDAATEEEVTGRNIQVHNEAGNMIYNRPIADETLQSHVNNAEDGLVTAAVGTPGNPNDGYTLDELAAGAEVGRGEDGNRWSISENTVDRVTPSGATETLNLSFGMKHASGLTWSASWAQAETDVDKHTTMADDSDIKPTYFQTTVGYVFGNNAIALSWYDGKETNGSSESEVTAIGVGFIHKMPKAGVELYAAAQNYDVADDWRLKDKATGEGPTTAPDVDETVMVVGARVKF